jgi:hypothetical protein
MTTYYFEFDDETVRVPTGRSTSWLALEQWFIIMLWMMGQLYPLPEGDL